MTLEHQQKHISIFVYVGIVVATLVAYEPIRHNYFVSYDDDLYIGKPRRNRRDNLQFGNPRVHKAIRCELAPPDVAQPHAGLPAFRTKSDRTSLSQRRDSYCQRPAAVLDSQEYHGDNVGKRIRRGGICPASVTGGISGVDS